MKVFFGKATGRVGTIHDSILTTPDKADEVRDIMVREFRRFGLHPTISIEI